jgi:hypothetical protein
MKTAALSGMFTLLLAASGCKSSDNLLLVENNSDFVCTSVAVSVCDSSWAIQNMFKGDKYEFTVKYTTNDAFHVGVRFENGRSLSGTFGSATAGIIGDRIRISIENESINFRQSGNNH